MTYPEKIVLHSRDPKDHYLEKIDRGNYKLVCGIDFVRVIFEEDNKTINAIDLPGGPMVCVDEQIEEGLKIKKIYHSLHHQGIVIVLEPCK